MNTSAILKDFELFKDATEHEIDEVAKGSCYKTYDSNTIVLSEGDESNTVYFILKGRLQVYLSNQSGKLIIIKDLCEQESFGELGVVCNTERSANIITKSETVLIAITGASYKNYYQNNLLAAQSVINILASSLAKLTKDYESLALDDLSHRLIRLLLDLSEEEEGSLIVNHTHNEIANRVASSREAVTRAISAMKSSELLEANESGIRLTNKLISMYAHV
jgi:cAMP-binding proteins - catabolite gene activator and regulatory subunit of cAMP-dependent protein kinases